MPESAKNPGASKPSPNKKRRTILWVALAVLAVFLYLQSPFAASVKYAVKELDLQTDLQVWRDYDEDGAYIYSWRLEVPEGVSASELLQTFRWGRTFPALFAEPSLGISVGDDHYICIYPGKNKIVVANQYCFPTYAWYAVSPEMMEELLLLMTPTPQADISSKPIFEFYHTYP